MKKIKKNENGKECTKCGEFLPWSDFYKSKNKNYLDGHTYYCKNCSRKQALERIENQTEEQRSRRLSLVREYTKSLTPQQRTAQKKKYLEKMKNERPEQYEKYKKLKLEQKKRYKERLKKEGGEQWEKYKKRRNKAKRKYMKNSPRARMIKNLRKRLAAVIKLKGGRKPESYSKTIGCSPKELYQHIENKFVEGMSWGNYGEWHVDHIKPISKHDLDDPKEVEKINHYSNLQPLWAKDNIEKGNFYTDETL